MSDTESNKEILAEEESLDSDAEINSSDNEEKDEVVSQNKTSSKGSSRSNFVKLDGFVIQSDSLLPTYDNGPIKAYSAGTEKDGATGGVALVCEKHYSPRLREIEKYRAVVNNNSIRLRKHGVVYWPPVKQERYVFIYEGDMGNPLMKARKTAGLCLKQDVVLEKIVRPMVNLLQDFHAKGLVHGNIRPDNIFDGGTGELRSIVLGDCLSVPLYSTQPALYTTIENGMADSIARGLGKPGDDLYALGMSVAVLMRANDPLGKLSDEEIVRYKFEKGSYAAATGKDRFTGTILELLRGLLHDNPSERWTIDDVLSWLDGRRIPPRQNTREKKSLRPFVFNKKSFFYKQTLAMEFQHNPFELVQVIEDGTLLQWVDRSVEDDKALERLEEFVQSASAKGRGGDYNERMASFASIALDPTAPVRYKGMCIRSGGLGAALSKAIVLKQDVKPFVDLFLQDIIFKWLASYEGARIDTASFIQRYEDCKRSLRQGTMGHGVERCAYILNGEAHCYSDKLSEYHVYKPETLILALEKMCSKNELDGLILDRHMVAFLSHTDSRVVDPYLFDLNSSEYFNNVMGNLNCLAAMQGRYKIAALPGLAKVIYDMLPVVFKRFHDKQVRERLRDRTKRCVKSGSLLKMAELLNDTANKKQDYQGFVKAVKEYRDLSKSYIELEEGMKDTSKFGKTTGKSVTAVFSTIVSTLIILLIAYSFFAGSLGG